ncbi:MAG: C4-type zinc ribbon domain-containing protein [Crocinitomicaceae bacterium]|jgi:predicted  nucleic acid-binding Zn-ribbon protein|tara:strand:+ start:1444 stop:2286 length:843 start_codon:yes stop_codon:yes gene_type:complete
MPATSTKAKKETAPKKTAKVSKATAKKDVSISDKLDSLFNLQKIDSEIDRIRIIRGELPLEVEDLENEIIGLETRTGKIQDEIDELQLDITNRKNSSKEADAAILKYKDRQNNVRNNREFESLSKEIEFQELEIKLNEKRTKEGLIKIESKKEVLTEATERFDMKKAELETKKSELDTIISSTQKDENKLIKASTEAKKNIEERLVIAYQRLRGNSKNGLSVVELVYGEKSKSGHQDASCGGCFNKIPPQRELDIVTKKKIIICEHCGRILIPTEVEEEA